MTCVIDVGSNTVRLAIYEVKNKNFKKIFTKKINAELVGFIDKSNTLSPTGIKKLISSLNEFKQILDIIKVQNTFVFATASLRNISNTDEVVSYVLDKIGLQIDVISGEDEALFDYLGATINGKVSNGLMIDIGGGSTELVFVGNNKIERSFSLPIGSLNSYKKYCSKLFPNMEEIANLKYNVLLYLKELDLDYKKTVILGVGGTARAVSLLAKTCNLLSGEKTLYSAENLNILLDLYKDYPDDFARKIASSTPDRIHTLLPGLVMFETIISYFGGQTIKTCNYGVKEGYLAFKLGII